MFYGDRIPDASSVDAVARRAEACEAVGMATVWSSEAARDPFLMLMPALQATKAIRVGTGIAVAYARSPYATAMAAWDLQRFSGGRFQLGLATQVRPHIERRYGTAWPGGVGALREYVLCLRAIWHTFQTGDRPDFKGEHYRFTLMNPEFQPRALPEGHDGIPVWLAAVGTRSARLAGEVAEGLHIHAFHTPHYLRDVLLPTVADGRRAAGRHDAIQATCPVLAGIAHDDDQERALRDHFRHTIAFYGSTAAYLPVLEHAGLSHLQEPLALLAREREWARMDDLIEDDVVDLFAVIDEPRVLARRLGDRYEGILDELALYRGGDRFARGDDMAVLVDGLAARAPGTAAALIDSHLTGRQ